MVARSVSHRYLTAITIVRAVFFLFVFSSLWLDSWENKKVLGMNGTEFLMLYVELHTSLCLGSSNLPFPEYYVTYLGKVYLMYSMLEAGESFRSVSIGMENVL